MLLSSIHSRMNPYGVYVSPFHPNLAPERQQLIAPFPYNAILPLIYHKYLTNLAQQNKARVESQGQYPAGGSGIPQREIPNNLGHYDNNNHFRPAVTADDHSAGLWRNSDHDYTADGLTMGGHESDKNSAFHAVQNNFASHGEEKENELSKMV